MESVQATPPGLLQAEKKASGMLQELDSLRDAASVAATLERKNTELNIERAALGRANEQLIAKLAEAEASMEQAKAHAEEEANKVGKELNLQLFLVLSVCSFSVLRLVQYINT